MAAGAPRITAMTPGGPPQYPQSPQGRKRLLRKASLESLPLPAVQTLREQTQLQLVRQQGQSTGMSRPDALGLADYLADKSGIKRLCWRLGLEGGQLLRRDLRLDQPGGGEFNNAMGRLAGQAQQVTVPGRNRAPLLTGQCGTVIQDAGQQGAEVPTPAQQQIVQIALIDDLIALQVDAQAVAPGQ